MLAGSLALLGAITSVTGCSESEISLDGEYPMGMQGQHLIDDFADKGNNEPIGAGWEFISDQVMGGVSTGKIDFGRWEDRSCLHMTGLVSLENNGGFIQARLKLNPKAKYLDASSFTGVSIRVKGNGESYALHLHTKHTWLPWQFYQAEFQTNEAWQDIKVSFKKFQPVSLKNKLDTSKLKSIAIVAIKKEFQADILVDQVSFYVEKTMYKKLTPQEEDVIINKGTEPPFTGKYHDHFEKGAYVCKQCGARLFESSSKLVFLQIQIGLWLAQFRRPSRRCSRKEARCRRNSDRNPLCQLRRSPGTCVRGRSSYAQEYSLLREFDIHGFCPRRQSGNAKSDLCLGLFLGDGIPS
jgi:hypothetical protein